MQSLDPNSLSLVTQYLSLRDTIRLSLSCKKLYEIIPVVIKYLKVKLGSYVSPKNILHFSNLQCLDGIIKIDDEDDFKSLSKLTHLSRIHILTSEALYKPSLIKSLIERNISHESLNLTVSINPTVIVLKLYKSCLNVYSGGNEFIVSLKGFYNKLTVFSYDTLTVLDKPLDVIKLSNLDLEGFRRCLDYIVENKLTTKIEIYSNVKDHLNILHREYKGRSELEIKLFSHIL